MDYSGTANKIGSLDLCILEKSNAMPVIMSLKDFLFWGILPNWAQVCGGGRITPKESCR